MKQKFSTTYINKLEKAYTKAILKRNGKYLQKELSANKSFFEKPIVKFAAESISTFTAVYIKELLKS
jgi:hypothetical protein